MHYFHYSELLALHAIKPLIVYDEDQTRDMIVQNIIAQQTVPPIKSPKKDEIIADPVPASPSKTRSPSKSLQGITKSPKKSKDPNKSPSKWKMLNKLLEQAAENPDGPRSLRSTKSKQ